MELRGSHVKAPYEPGGQEVVWRSAWKPAELKSANNLWESGTIEALVISEARQWIQLSSHL